MKEFYRILIDGVSDELTVKQLVHGPAWTGAELSDGSFGIAMHTPVESVPRMFDSLVGMTAKAAAEAVMSWNLEEASEGMAVINAFYNTVERMKEKGWEAEYDRICTTSMETEGKTFAFIGHLRMPSETVRGAKMVYIIERDPRPGDYPDSSCEYILPECDITLITGSAAVNKTMPRLIELSKNGEVILIGPTVPMCPELKKLGISRLSGMVVRDKQGLIDWMTQEKGNPYPFGYTFMIK